MSGRVTNGKSSARHCEQAAHTLVEALARQLLEEAERQGGVVSAASIRAHLEGLQDEESRFSRAFRKACGECLKEHEREVWDRARRRPFDRALVKRFSHLFPPEDGLKAGTSYVSRRLLPGFFAAFEMMAGPQVFDRCHEACQRIVERKRKEADGLFEWQDLYDDNDANALVDEALVEAARQFSNFEHRFDWLHTLLKSHMAPAQDYEFEGGAVAEWTVTEETVHSLLRALYGRFARPITRAPERAGLDARFGRDGVRAVEHLLWSLAHHR